MIGAGGTARALALAALLGLAAGGCAGPGSPVAGTARADSLTPWLAAATAEVQAALQASLEAQSRRDAAATLAFYADDFRAVRPDGSVLDKAGVAAVLGSTSHGSVEIGPGSFWRI